MEKSLILYNNDESQSIFHIFGNIPAKVYLFQH
jgi:hypothetical protein